MSRAENEKGTNRCDSRPSVSKDFEIGSKVPWWLRAAAVGSPSAVYMAATLRRVGAGIANVSVIVLCFGPLFR